MAVNGYVRNKSRESKVREDARRSGGEEEGYPSNSNGSSIPSTVRKRLEDIREVLRTVEKQLDLTELLEKNVNDGLIADSHLLKTNKKTDEIEKRPINDGRSKQKVFLARDSELTELLKTQHIATIYNIFVAVLLLLFLSTVTHDLLNSGSVQIGFGLIYQSFSPLSTALLVWSQMMISACALYYGYFFWAKTRVSLSLKGLTREVYDKVMFSLLIIFYIQHIVIPAWQVTALDFPFGLSMAILAEQVRLLMKTYAFIRTNVPRTLAYKAKASGEYFAVTFDKFLYYLFVPTLIYKDDYPRTSHIRWDYAAARFLEVIGIIFYMAFIAERYIIPNTRDFGKPGVPPSQILAIVLDNAFPGIVLGVCTFYCVLHAWLNGMAEILRFADRLFYKDWWNTTKYAVFYKTWNIVVYDWLYAFLYEDAGAILFQNKKLKAFFVIGVSAIFHEYIMAVALGFFMPMYIIIYGIGGPAVMSLTVSNRTLGNIWIWFSLCLGAGIFSSFYTLEYYVRINCPPAEKSPVWDFFVPRLLTCPYS